MNEVMKAVLRLSNKEKYDYFIDTILECEEVWILMDAEGCASLGNAADLILPVWPKEEYAKECISGEWAGYQASSIGLDVFMNRWLPGLSEDGIRLNLLWMDGKGVEVSIEDLLEDLREELAGDETEEDGAEA